MAKIINLQEWVGDNNTENGNRLFLTEKQIRSFPGFENTPDDEVINIINTLHQLSLITYELITTELNQKLADNQTA